MAALPAVIPGPAQRDRAEHGRDGLVPETSVDSLVAIWGFPHLSDNITRTSQMTCANQKASRSCRAPWRSSGLFHQDGAGIEQIEALALRVLLGLGPRLGGDDGDIAAGGGSVGEPG